MARQPSAQREILEFLQTGKPSTIATFLAENPSAALPFLGLRSEQQLIRFNTLLKSNNDREVEVALKRLDDALEKRADSIAAFIEEDEPAKKPPQHKKAAEPKKGKAKAEFKENIVLAAFSAGHILRDLAPWKFKPYEAFRDSVKLLTESIAATLSAAGLSKTQRHIVELTTGLPAFAVLSTKAAGSLTGLAMSFSSMTTDVEAALPKMPDVPPQTIAAEFEHFTPLQITVSREGTETAIAALNSNFTQAHHGHIPHFSYTDNGIRYRDWSVPETVANAILNSSDITGIPAQILFSMIGPESSFIADNLNEDTQACGLGQFIPSTLYEKVYNYGTLIGYPHVQNLVERFVERRDEQNRPYYGFRPKSEEAAAQIRTACMDPAFNTRLNSVYIARNVGHMQEALKQYAPSGYNYYPVNFTQTYLAHFSGIGRALDMIEDMHINNGQTLAHMYFNRIATDANLNYLFVNGNRDAPRTVAQFISFLENDKKLGNNILPDMRNWSAHRQLIQANVQMASAGGSVQQVPHTPFN